MTISEVIHIAWMSAEISEFHLGGWWQQVLNTNCVLVCSSKTNCLVEDEKKALWAGNTLLSVCVCLREREMKWMFVSRHYLDLDFPKAVYKALNLCVCVCVRREEQDSGAGGCEVSSVCSSVTLWERPYHLFHPPWRRERAHVLPPQHYSEDT